MRAENWEDRVDGADIDDNGGEMEGGSEGVKKKKRQEQDGGIEEREGRREAQNCTWPLTGSNSSVSSDSSELTVLF